MTVTVSAITFDCQDAAAVARFWSAALEQPLDAGEGGATEFFASIGRDAPRDRPALMFLKVPEDRAGKNRVHLDLDADDRAAAVERLVGLGATVLHDKDEWGTRWTTLADPEGNEFCVATRR